MYPFSTQSSCWGLVGNKGICYIGIKFRIQGLEVPFWGVPHSKDCSILESNWSSS